MPTSGDKRKRARQLGFAALALLLVVLFDGPVCRAEIGLIKAYRRVGSPVTRHVVTCRFQPTCSAYALQVLDRDGLWKGNWAVAKRLVNCSPFGYIADALAPRPGQSSELTEPRKLRGY